MDRIIQRGCEILRSLDWYKKLSEKKGRQEAGFFVCEGERAVSQLISAFPDRICEILKSDDSNFEVPANLKIRILSKSQFKAVSTSITPQGVSAIVAIPEESFSDSLPELDFSPILLCEDIQDPGNIGCLIRTAAAMGFSGVIMSEKCADPFSPKSVQSSAGTLLSVWIRRNPNYLLMAARLKANGWYVATADTGGEPVVGSCKFQPKNLLALGNEANGCSGGLRSMSDLVFSIPMQPGRAESLNVAACGAICMFLVSTGTGNRT